MSSDKILILTINVSRRPKRLVDTLTSAGYQVSLIKKEKTWPELIRDATPDLIIIYTSADKDINGEIQSLRINENLQFLPILTISAAKTIDPSANGHTTGADDHLELPLEPLKLIRKVSRLIERRQSTEVMGNRESYFRALIENGTDIITVLSLRGRIVYESPSVEKILGYKSTELIGRNSFEFIHPTDHRAVVASYKAKKAQSEFVIPIQYRFKHKNGSWRVLESVWQFVNFSEELFIIVNSRDITRRTSAEKARRRIEQKLAQAETRFKLALRAARMIWWEWDPQRNEIIVPDNLKEIYGTENIKEANEGFALVHPDDKERHQNTVIEAGKSGKSYHSEYRIVRPDNGEIVWLDENATPFPNENGIGQKIVGLSIDVTERKRAEMALRESEERLKAQYKGIPVPTYIWKKSGDDFILADYNDVAEEVSQKYISRLIGRTSQQVFPNFPKISNAIKKCFDKKKPIQFEMPYRYILSGEERQLEFRFVFIAPDLVIIYTHDITELRQTINSLKLSESRFQTVSRATSDVLWEWDFADDSLWWNENLYSAFGYRKEEVPLSADFWRRTIHPADYERVIFGINNAISSGENYWYDEYRYRCGNGSYSYILDRGYIERDEQGKALKMIGAMTDITPRKQVEDALHESRERLALAQQVGQIGSFDWNFQTNVIITSQQLENIYGADENFNGSYEYWLKFVHPDDVAKVAQDLQQSLVDGELSNEYRIFNADGRLRWLQSHIKVFYDEAGQPQRMVGVNMDITERKRSEEALQKSQEQLRQSQKLESVGRLAGGIAHDFNNMLTAINGYSDLILRSLTEDTSLRRKVIEIKKAGERSAELTQQLLAFSRQQILQPKLIDLDRIIIDMSQMLKRLIGEDVELHLDLYENVCCVEADPGQLSQVIMNLVVNSRDAMPEGGKLIIKTTILIIDEEYAAVHAPMSSGEYVLLSVEDTGSGIDKETLDYIFEPFFTTKKAGKGTGLGLSTVYGIVKQSGGYIWVDSEIGRGTTFKVFLPHIAKGRELLQPDHHVKKDLKGSETILLVEDEESVRKLVSQILQTYGYHVIEAGNGVEALKICKRAKLSINLLLTDVIMPLMNGRKLAEELVKIYPGVKILFTSGYFGDKGLLNKTVNLEKIFIPKPFTPDALADKVRKVLNGK